MISVMGLKCLTCKKKVHKIAAASCQGHTTMNASHAVPPAARNTLALYPSHLMRGILACLPVETGADCSTRHFFEGE